MMSQTSETDVATWLERYRDLFQRMSRVVMKEVATCIGGVASDTKLLVIHNQNVGFPQACHFKELFINFT